MLHKTVINPMKLQATRFYIMSIAVYNVFNAFSCLCQHLLDEYNDELI